MIALVELANTTNSEPCYTKRGFIVKAQTTPNILGVFTLFSNGDVNCGSKNSNYS
jgi:hypothetical protein